MLQDEKIAPFNVRLTAVVCRVEIPRVFITNFLTIRGISPLAVPVCLAALSIGLIGALMSCIGLYGGRQLRRVLQRFEFRRLDIAGAAYLLVLAFHMLATTSI
jgi:putative Mn2+ efflux pump MntP